MAKRDIKRNTSNQIVSYTLDPNGVDEYGTVQLPSTRTSFNKNVYDKVVDIDIVDLINTSDVIPLTLVNGNFITLPSEFNLETPLNLNWTGEIIKHLNEYYYIEDDVYYKLVEQDRDLMINIIAEKLGLPLLFKINEDYNYEAPNDVDFGQLHPFISNENTWKTRTISYVYASDEGQNLNIDDVVQPRENVYLRAYSKQIPSNGWVDNSDFSIFSVDTELLRLMNFIFTNQNVAFSESDFIASSVYVTRINEILNTYFKTVMPYVSIYGLTHGMFWFSQRCTEDRYGIAYIDRDLNIEAKPGYKIDVNDTDFGISTQSVRDAFPDEDTLYQNVATNIIRRVLASKVPVYDIIIYSDNQSATVIPMDIDFDLNNGINKFSVKIPKAYITPELQAIEIQPRIL